MLTRIRFLSGNKSNFQFLKQGVDRKVPRNVANKLVSFKGSKNISTLVLAAVSHQQPKRLLLKNMYKSSFSRNNLSTKGSDAAPDSEKQSGASSSSEGQNQASAEVGEKNGDKKDVMVYDDDEYDDYQQEPKTAGEKIKYGAMVLGQWTLIFGGMYFIYVLLQELFPGRMGPNNIFSEAFEIVRANDDVIAAVGGSQMKAYGRDSGRNSEGRRNHIDSRQYTADDGSKRSRIRFNVEGSRGKVKVWAEVSSKMIANEYVYLICQDMRTGRVITIQDNRGSLEAGSSSAGGNDKSTFSTMFGLKQ